MQKIMSESLKLLLSFARSPLRSFPMSPPLSLVLGLLLLFAPSHSQASDLLLADQKPEKIAFGSCYRTNKNARIWTTIGKQEPDLFLFLGDNIYGDTEKQAEMRKAYDALLTEKEYAAFAKKTPIIATWDDHDYGKNDAGVEFPAKDMAKSEFLRAFDFPLDHPIRKRDGVYHSVSFGPEGQRLQIIMLDTRWFRSALKEKGFGRSKRNIPNTDPGATILGEAQWKWLEQQLKEPADLRIIGSSIQVLATEHRFEKWANFPADLDKLRALLTPEIAERTLILSGDRHMGELMQDGKLKEATSSGLTNAGGGYKDEKNVHRIGERVGRRNFGMIEIDWDKKPIPAVKVKILGETGEVFLEKTWPK